MSERNIESPHSGQRRSPIGGDFNMNLRGSGITHPQLYRRERNRSLSHRRLWTQLWPVIEDRI